MGFGDEIMAAAEARRTRAVAFPRQVEILDRHGKRRWHELWEGNTDIARPGEGGDYTRIVNGPGCRPYVDYDRMRADFAKVFPGREFTTKVRDERLPWRYTDWRAVTGDVLPEVCGISTAAVIVEPHIKAGASPNKQWGWARWQELVSSRPDIDWMQIGPSGTRVLDGVKFLLTPGFLDAIAAVKGARAAVLPEGGLHHVAAAENVPAVVIFGGMTSPANTGYDAHVNLFDARDGSPCGQRVPCRHCDRAMASIKPETVAYHLEAML